MKLKISRIGSTQEKGFSLVETMIAVSLSAISLIALGAVFQNLNQVQQRANFLISLSQLRMTFQQAVIRTQDWNATTSALIPPNYPGMSCFSGATATSCLAQSQASGAPWPLALYSHNSGLIYDSSSSTSGYTMSGTPCNTYGTPGSCVLKPNLTWRLQCNLAMDANCLSPLVIVDLNYTYSGPPLGAINFSAYGFHILKGTFPMQQALACGGAMPSCSGSQQIVCVSNAWTCVEFGQ